MKQDSLPPSAAKGSLAVIFTTVFMDLVGFGIIIPLTPLFGSGMEHGSWNLALLGAAYSLCQFLFAPLWGQLSDRRGRRPILLMSLGGSTLAYVGFAAAVYAKSLPLLILTRALQGCFAANISAAQAYIADVTPPEKRAGGMALIGAAFGIGFILGPMLGGLSLKISELAPGLLAAAICGFNLLLAWRRLPESLSLELQLQNRAQAFRSYDPLNLQQLKKAWVHPYLGLLLAMSFLQVMAFSQMEQVFTLFFRDHLELDKEDAGLKTGYALAYVGLIGAAIMGGAIRKLAPRFGERRLLIVGLFLFASSLAYFPFGPPHFEAYFLILLPLAVGRSFIDPSTSTLISRAASAQEQGRAFGSFQGLSSLARALGPCVGLGLYSKDGRALPFNIAAALAVLVFGLSLLLFKRTAGLQGVDSRQA